MVHRDRAVHRSRKRNEFREQLVVPGAVIIIVLLILVGVLIWYGLYFLLLHRG